jgi:ferritin-like metal-binding protein YciE
MAKMNSLGNLFIDQLQDLYSAETQLVKALPKIAKAAAHPELQSALEEHLEQTKGHADRVKQILESLDEKVGGKKCKGMEGLIEEGKDILDQDGDDSVLDAGIIAAAQRVEHYEISGYGTARTFAQILGHIEAVDLLEQTLEEEKQADERLNEIAESTVNEEAAEGQQRRETEKRFTGRVI